MTGVQAGAPADFKFARDVLRRLPRGYRIAYGTSGDPHPSVRRRQIGKHPYLFDPSGALVRSPGGQAIMVPSTPGSVFALRALLALIRRAGVPVI